MVAELDLEHFVTLPLVRAERSLGFLLVDNRYSGVSLAPERVDVLQVLVRFATGILENLLLHESLERSLARSQASAEVLADIRRRINRAEKLAASGELSAAMAHEIRNPLTAIGGFSRRLLRSGSLAETDRRTVQVIADEALRLEETLGRLLHSAQREELQVRPVDINALVKDIESLLRDRVAEAGIRLRSELEPDLPRLTLDERRIRQVLLNLVQNAIEAIEGRGEIRLETEREDGWLLLHVADDGCGMEPEQQKRIFRAFYSTKDAGTGLGLALSQRVVHQHGGELTVDSTRAWARAAASARPCAIAPPSNRPARPEACADQRQPRASAGGPGGRGPPGRGPAHLHDRGRGSAGPGTGSLGAAALRAGVPRGHHRSAGAGKSSLLDGLLRAYRARGLSLAVVAVDPAAPSRAAPCWATAFACTRRRAIRRSSSAAWAAAAAWAGFRARTEAVRRPAGRLRARAHPHRDGGRGPERAGHRARTAYTTVVVLTPESGDGIQTMKAGLMEIGDLFVVNKADREGAEALAMELESTLSGRGSREGWLPPVLRSVATRGEGAEGLLEAIEAHRAFLGAGRPAWPCAATRPWCGACGGPWTPGWARPSGATGRRCRPWRRGLPSCSRAG